MEREVRVKKSISAIFGIYILIALVLLPLIAPLRALGLAQPGFIRALILPPILLLLVVSSGFGRSIVPKSTLQLVLIAVFFVASVRGLENLVIGGGDIRNYFSHLFQLASAYIMISMGWLWGRFLPENFWRKLVFLSLVATTLSSLVTLFYWNLGDVGRLYTPAYNYIFISSFAFFSANSYLPVVLLGLIVSNKRGPIVSVISMLAARFAMMLFGSKKILKFRTRTVAACAILLIVFIPVLLFSLYYVTDADNQNNGYVRAANVTMHRMGKIFVGDGRGDLDLSEVTSGRTDEVDSVINALEPLDYLFGAGAGWGVKLPEGKEVHNIHFSPISLTASFGAPFAFVLYSYILIQLILGFRNRRVKGSLAERAAPYYVFGAMVHSLAAYSLFIDLLFFFFLGVLSKSNYRKS